MHEVDKVPPPQVRMNKPIAVLWLTNLAAPYRIPVWKHLAEQHKLFVGLLESNSGLERDKAANRGRDWLHVNTAGITFNEIPTWKFRRGESRYYILKNPKAMLDMRRFDVVLFGGWESPAYWMLLVAANIFRVGRVAFYESPLSTMTYRSGPFAWLRSRFFRAMDVVVVPGEAAAQAVLGMGVHPSRLLRGFNAVDVTAFHEAAFNPSREIPPTSGAGHRYLYVGQLIERKRVRDIIDAFAKIAGPDDELTIVGEGGLRNELRYSASNVTAKVTFIEHIENSKMPALMANQHTLILASEREVWGLVVNEALASGMHVVVADNCGVFPSVKGMRGVYPTSTDLQNLSEQLQVSRANWRGRIAAPEVLQYTPVRFAEVFASAIVKSFQGSSRRSPAKNGERTTLEHGN